MNGRLSVLTLLLWALSPDLSTACQSQFAYEIVPLTEDLLADFAESESQMEGVSRRAATKDLRTFLTNDVVQSFVVKEGGSFAGIVSLIIDESEDYNIMVLERLDLHPTNDADRQYVINLLHKKIWSVAQQRNVVELQAVNHNKNSKGHAHLTEFGFKLSDEPSDDLISYYFMDAEDLNEPFDLFASVMRRKPE